MRDFARHLVYGQSPKTKSGDECEPHTFGGETTGGVE